MNLMPDFASRRSIPAELLPELDEPAVIFEHFHVDSDGAHAYLYTVAGYLHGRNIAVDDDGAFRGGCTVGGDVIVVHADTRAEADAKAGCGLLDTIDLLRDAPPGNAGLTPQVQLLNA